MITYVVQRGDTLFSIAQKFGSTVSAIVQANNITDPNLIFVGQVLRIPVANGADQVPIPTPGAREIAYVVQPGETLTSIARKFRTTVQAIVRRNRIPDPDLITAGAVLIIPLRAVEVPEQPPTPPQPPADQRRIATRTIDGLQYILYVDRFRFNRGEPIRITLLKRNTTENRTFVLEYPSSKKYEFIIRYNGDVVWRWSRGKFFTPAVERRRLRPGETVIYRETWNQEFNNGQEARRGLYRLIGWNTATPNVRLSVQFRIT